MYIGGALAACVMAAMPAHAEEPPKTWKVAVMQLGTVEGLPEQTVKALADLIATEMTDTGRFEVVTSSDIQAVLGFEGQKQLLGCGSETSCLAEIGGALGVEFIVGGNIARLGDQWLLSLSLIDTGNGRPRARTSERTRDDGELVDLTLAATRKLISSVVPDQYSGAVAATTPPPPEDEQASGGGGVLGWVGIGLGVATLGTGVGLYGSALNVKRQFNEGQDGPMPPTVTWEDAQTATRNSGIGVGLAAGGVALLIGGVFLLPGDDTAEEGLTLAVSPTGLVLGGRW